MESFRPSPSSHIYPALRLDPTLFVEIMGSYRRYVVLFCFWRALLRCDLSVVRGKTDCGDIDILITRCPDDGHTHEGGPFCTFSIFYQFNQIQVSFISFLRGFIPPAFSQKIWPFLITPSLSKPSTMVSAAFLTFQAHDVGASTSLLSHIAPKEGLFCITRFVITCLVMEMGWLLV